MNIHPVFQERLDHAICLLRHSAGQTTAEILNRAAYRPQDGNLLSPEAAFYLGLNYDGECINPDTRRPLDRNISDLSPAGAAQALADHDPTIMDPAHLTTATSLHRIRNHDLTAIAELIEHLDATARRIIHQGRPSVPAIRWAFADGSALVQYGFQITAAVHESRLDLIRDEYRDEARQGLRRVQERFRTQGYSLKPGFSAPEPAFASANDGLYSHQAALPVGATRCWCGRHPGIHNEARINRII